MKLKNKIPVIDLFAGPGGLAEGFSSLIQDGQRVFNICLSIEKDADAHKTLELRSFCRQFPYGHLPREYYDALRESDLKKRDQKIQKLYMIYPNEGEKAKYEAWKAELGSKKYPPELVDERIIEALKGSKDWVLIGGPPCQAYSIVGRSRVGGIDNNDHRVYLYKEYLRIIAKHQPAVFVMENVQGLLSAKLNGQGIFNRILEDLEDPSKVFSNSQSKKYRIFSLVEPKVNKNSDYLIKAELFGIPQKRHRIILLGIRGDLDIIPGKLKRKEAISLESVIGNLPKIRSGLSRKFISSYLVNGRKKRIYKPVNDSSTLWENYVNSFKEEILSWNNLNNYGDKNLIKSPESGTGSEYLNYPCYFPDKHPLKSWYLDPNFTGVIHHKSRSHLVEDLSRYLFASIFTATEGRFPRLKDFEKHNTSLMPDHENAKTGKFEDRFRVQLPYKPATTITSHISKDGHYFIHYDPNQCRTLTVREAARIQTFPDNYLFRGSQTAQYHQVGNAVPPYLAKQIGEIVFQVIKNI